MDLLRAARDVAAATADLHRLGPGVDWELHRHVSGKNALRELEEESASPLRDALAAHVEWLTVARVSQPAARRVAAALAEPSAVVRLERDVQKDARAVVAGLLASKTPGEARAHFAALPEIGPVVGEPAKMLREVRAEAFRRLGIDDVGARFLGVPSRELVGSARAFLAATSDLARESRSRESWPLDLDVRLAAGAREGWPSRMTWRSAASLLPGLAARSAMEGEPPRALGAVSFARALAAIGAVVRREPPGSRAPFVLRGGPLSPDPARAGCVFASALGERAFHARVLGLASGRASDQARSLRTAFFHDARFAAMRVALRERGDFDALTALALGAPLPAALDEAWPLLVDEDLARWLALLATPPLLDVLLGGEGDDWFRNPRAFETLAELWQEPVRPAEGAAERLARRFEELLA